MLPSLNHHLSFSDSIHLPRKYQPLELLKLPFFFFFQEERQHEAMQLLLAASQIYSYPLL